MSRVLAMTPNSQGMSPATVKIGMIVWEKPQQLYMGQVRVTAVELSADWSCIYPKELAHIAHESFGNGDQARSSDENA